MGQPPKKKGKRVPLNNWENDPIGLATSRQRSQRWSQGSAGVDPTPRVAMPEKAYGLGKAWDVGRFLWQTFPTASISKAVEPASASLVLSISFPIIS